MRHERLERVGELRRARRGVRRHGNRAQRNDHLRQQRLIQRRVRRRKSAGDRRMGVNDGVDLRAHAINQKVHADFGGGFAFAREFAAFEFDDDDGVRKERALRARARRNEDAPGIQAHRNVALGGYHEAAITEPAPGDAQLAAVIFFGLGVAV